MKFDPFTRILHLLVAIGVTLQLALSLVMVAPKPDRAENVWYEAHEFFGTTLVVVISVYWVWIIARTVARDEPFMLFPWFSPRLRQALIDDVKATMNDLAAKRLPSAQTVKPLPAAVQGLGLLLALFMAMTGTVVELGMGPDGSLPPLVHAVKEVHETMAPLMWAYLVVHPLVGFLHQFMGERIVSSMFDFKNR